MGQRAPRAEFADYVRALQRIALGQDPTASARDRLTALKELLKLGKSGTSTYINANPGLDKMMRKRWAEALNLDELFRLKRFEKSMGLSGE